MLRKKNDFHVKSSAEILFRSHTIFLSLSLFLLNPLKILCFSQFSLAFPFDFF